MEGIPYIFIPKNFFSLMGRFEEKRKYLISYSFLFFLQLRNTEHVKDLNIVLTTSVLSENGDWNFKFSAILHVYWNYVFLKLYIIARMYLFFLSKINTHCEWLVAVQRPWRVIYQYGLVAVGYPCRAIILMPQ